MPEEISTCWQGISLLLCYYQMHYHQDALLVHSILRDPMIGSVAPQKMIKPIFLGTLLAGLAFLPVPANAMFSVCGFRWLSGIPCPLCGMTRALSFLLKGQWESALRFHSLSPVVLSLLLITFFNDVLSWILPKKFPLTVSSQVKAWLYLGLVITFSCYGFFRVWIAS
jgi:hypothetical protein